LKNSISIIEFLDKIEDGVGVLLSFILDENVYEMIYWFNKKGEYSLVVEPKFYEHYNIDSIYNMPYINELISHIENVVLPPKNEIYKEFGL
jgi:hypothetical protein